jgi:LysM domain
MNSIRETRQMTRKETSLFALFRVFSGPVLLFLLAASGIAAEVRREQFSKPELDDMGYPTNTALATELGRTEARRELTNVIVRLPAYGLPAPWAGEYDRILMEKYRVGSFGLAGCLVSQGLVAYASGYSEITRKHIEGKYGTNFWRDVRKAPERSLNRGEYRVRAGDTFSRIAKERGVTLKTLTDANPKLDPTKLKVGQIILVPEQSKR